MAGLSDDRGGGVGSGGGVGGGGCHGWREERGRRKGKKKRKYHVRCHMCLEWVWKPCGVTSRLINN